MSENLIRQRTCLVGGGAEIHYLECESTDKSNPLLLLHSFASGAFLWRNWIRSLQFSGRILAPDLPGNGKSSLPPEKPVLSYHVRFLKDFCEATKVNRFAGCGVSMGSNILAAFALEFPEMITNLVLLNPIDDTAPLNRLWRIIAQPGIGELITRIFPASKKVLQKQVSRNFYNAEMLKPELIEEWWKVFNSGVVRRWIPKALRVPVTPINWQDINVPCTVVFGKNDPVVKNTFRIRLQTAFKRASYVELDQCGHYPHLEYPERIEELVTKDLHSVSSRPS